MLDYERWDEIGLLGAVTIPLPERITRRIKRVESGCWEWGGAVTHDGYGRVQVQRPRRAAVMVHRLVYRFTRGEIPSDLQLDHLCRVRHCCNPLHLDAVTCKENVRRSPIHFGSKTHCPRGHQYTDANIEWSRRGGRRCRECRRSESRKWNAYYRSKRIRENANQGGRHDDV